MPKATKPISRAPSRVVLKSTDIPGVFRNKAGTLTDECGIALSFKALRTKDNERFSEALDGGAVLQPADLLKAIALDPRQPLHVRLDAANKAAGYFTPKRVAVQGVEGAPPIGIADVSKLNQKDLDKLEAALELASALMDKAK
jgi:hypothetical protein